MTNEQYLHVSYVVGGLVSVGLGLLVYGSLRAPFLSLMAAVPTGNLARVLRKLFGIGMVAPALAGFLSVSIPGASILPGCTTKLTYEDIVADRAYMVEKNQEQLAAVLRTLGWAVFGWALLVLSALLLARLPIRSSKTVVLAAFVVVVGLMLWTL